MSERSFGTLSFYTVKIIIRQNREVWKFSTSRRSQASSATRNISVLNILSLLRQGKAGSREGRGCQRKHRAKTEAIPTPRYVSVFYRSLNGSLSELLMHGLAGWGLFVPWFLCPAPLYLGILIPYIIVPDVAQSARKYLHSE